MLRDWDCKIINLQSSTSFQASQVFHFLVVLWILFSLWSIQLATLPLMLWPHVNIPPATVSVWEHNVGSHRITHGYIDGCTLCVCNVVSKVFVCPMIYKYYVIWNAISILMYNLSSCNWLVDISLTYCMWWLNVTMFCFCWLLEGLSIWQFKLFYLSMTLCKTI